MDQAVKCNYDNLERLIVYAETQDYTPLHRKISRSNGKGLSTLQGQHSQSQVVSEGCKTLFCEGSWFCFNLSLKSIKGKKTISDSFVTNKKPEDINKKPENEDDDKHKNVVGKVTSNLECTNNQILIVEDNPVNMILIKFMLLQLLPKASITKKMNGKDAVKHCNKNTPDIIFMDLLMPEMNGFETTKQIRLLHNCKKIPIIAVTAGNIKDAKEKSESLGINDFIEKPINKETLTNTINKWLNSEEERKKSTKAITEKPAFGAKKVLNKEKLQTFITDDTKVASEIFEVAKTELQLTCEKLLKHAKNNKQKLLKKEAHKLKGTVGALGLEVMAAKVVNLMNQDNSDSKHILILTEDICSSLENLLVLIKNEINKLK